MPIKRSHIEIVDFTVEEFKDSDENISYCKHCLEYGFQVILRNRIYPEGEPVPPDHENWRQCHECGLVVAVYELEKEASVTDVVDTVESPFELGSDFLGVDSRKLGKKKKKEMEVDYINDEDLKRELAKGHTLISYTES